MDYGVFSLFPIFHHAGACVYLEECVFSPVDRDSQCVCNCGLFYGGFSLWPPIHCNGFSKMKVPQ